MLAGLEGDERRERAGDGVIDGIRWIDASENSCQWHSISLIREQMQNSQLMQKWRNKDQNHLNKNQQRVHTRTQLLKDWVAGYRWHRSVHCNTNVYRKNQENGLIHKPPPLRNVSFARIEKHNSKRKNISNIFIDLSDLTVVSLEVSLEFYSVLTS